MNEEELKDLLDAFDIETGENECVNRIMSELLDFFKNKYKKQ